MSPSCLVLLVALSAAPGSEAERRFARAVSLHDVGDHEGALAEFLAVYELKPRAGVAFNVALEQARLGRPVDAVGTLERLLDAPGSLDAGRLQRARALLEEQRELIGELVLVSADAPQELVVEVDNVTRPDAAVGQPLRVKAGHRLLTVLARNALPLRLAVDVAPRTRREVTLTMKRSDEPPARLELSCPVPGTPVVLDGALLGRTPFSAPLFVPAGRHTLAVQREGYRPLRLDLELAAGEARAVPLALELDPAGPRGALTLQSPDAPLVAIVDGVPLGAVSGPLALPPGEHALRLERGGFFPHARTVNVDATAPTAVRVSLELTADGRAGLEASAAQHHFWGLTLGGAGAGAAAGGLIAVTASSVLLGAARTALVAARSDDLKSPGCCDEAVRSSAARVTALEWWQAGGVATAAVGALLLAGGAWAWLSGPDLSRYDRVPDDALSSWGLLLGPGGVGVRAVLP